MVTIAESTREHLIDWRTPTFNVSSVSVADLDSDGETPLRQVAEGIIGVLAGDSNRSTHRVPVSRIPGDLPSAGDRWRRTLP